MRTVLRNIICSLICFVLIASPASAQTPAVMQMKWEGDYQENSSPKLIITFKTPANYISQVTGVMYPFNTTDSLSPYVRMTEVTVEGSQEMKIIFKITNSLEAPEGKYKILLQGNGYMSDNSRKEDTVFVITPDNIKAYLSIFNSSESALSLLSDTLENMIKALQLSPDAERRNDRILSMLDMRKDDFQNSFKTLEDIRNAYIVSDVIVYLSQADAQADVLQTKIENSAKSAALNINDEDYKKYNSIVYESLINYEDDIKTASDLRTAVGKILAVPVINASPTEDMEVNVKKYASSIGITEDYITKFDDNFDSEQKKKILNQLYNKGFLDSGAIAKAFKYSVDNPPAIGGTATDTNDKGSSVGGSEKKENYKIEISDKPLPSSKNFYDCKNNHWAYSYVTALADKGIINGYTDGGFKPEKTVSREEFVKMIISATGLYDKNADCEFLDVAKDTWYYNYIASAYRNNIISGINEDFFGVGNMLTREDASVIATRIISKFSYITEPEQEKGFSDFNSISDYAKESVQILSKIKIINGFEDGTYRPKGFLTRAEASKIIYMIRTYLTESEED